MKTLIPLNVVREDIMYLNYSMVQNFRLGRIDLHKYDFELPMITYNFLETGVHKTTSTFYNFEIIRLAKLIKAYIGEFSMSDARYAKYIELLDKQK